MAYKVISGLFKVVNIENGKYYISSSKNIKSAWAGIRSDLNHNNCAYEDFQKDWNTYSYKSFELIIIKEVPVDTSREEISAIKVEYFEKNKGDVNCYNIHSNPRNGILTGKDNKCNKKVVCLNTGKVFNSIALTHGYFGANETNIGVSCKIKHRTTGKKDGVKLCWEYYEDYLKLSQDDISNRISYANSYNGNIGRVASEEQKEKMRKPRINKEYMFRFSDDEVENKKLFLIDELQRFYSIYHRMPKSRELIASKGWSTQYTYIKYFGSISKAWIAAGFEIPEEKHKLIGRNNQLTEKEYIDRTKNILDEYFSNADNVKLPSCEYIVNQDDKMSESGIYRRFNKLQNLLDIIGYTKEFERDKIIKDMSRKYLEIMNILGRTPNSRDIENFSRNNDGYYYSMSSYEEWFGGVYDLQNFLEVESTIPLGRTMTRDEVIDGLNRLHLEIEDVPTQVDICECDYLPNIISTLSITGFSSMGELQKALFGKTYSKVKVTKGGTKCLSQYEYTFARVLEKYNYDFKKDVPYRDLGIKIKERLTVDFAITIGNMNYMIEIFGMTGNKDYEEKTAYKIKLCKDHSIPLLELYPDDFYSMTQEKWNNKIKLFIESKSNLINKN